MEELRPEELEDLLQELQGESDQEDALSPEVEQLLRDLQPARRFTARLRAARQLGEVSSSSHQIVQALTTVAESDASDEARAMAAESLRAPVHQEYLQEVLERKKAIDIARQQRRFAQRQISETKGSAGRRMPQQQSRIPARCLKAGSAVGLTVGLAIGLWYAPQPGLPVTGITLLVAFTAGAVLGAVAGVVEGAERQGSKDRVTGVAVGAVTAAVVASVSWWPAAIALRILGFLFLILS